MMLPCKIALSFIVVFLFSPALSVRAQRELLGVKFSPGIQALVAEIEKKTGKRIKADFVEQEAFTLGSSYVSDVGEAVVAIDFSLKNQPRKLEAVVGHELLHLRLRVNGYPVFLFAPNVRTRRGLAQDVEQPNVNDLASLIEHRIFKTDMDSLGLNEIIDLAGDAVRSARQRKGESDSQSDAINYCRAILEYKNQSDVEELRRVYEANGWEKSIEIGAAIANIIKNSALKSPADSESVFLRCLAKLYPSPRPARLKLDTGIKAYRRMLISF